MCFRFISVYCQDSSYINFQVPSTVIYQKEDLIISCELAITPSKDDLVHYIRLYKNISGTSEKLVLIAFSNNAGANNSYLKINWDDPELEKRADINGSAVYPVTDAKLLFRIPKEKMSCNDSGTYQCIISAFLNNTLSVSSYGSVKLKGQFCHS